MLAILLGLGSGLCWGTADFFGGLQSRRFPVLAVTLWSQIAGALALGLVLRIGGEPLDPGGLAWGAAAGAFGGAALLLFYRGLAVGPMSVVAPVSATGAVVPVLVAFALGEIPRPAVIAGMLAALAGVVLASRPGESVGQASGQPRLGLALALGAAAGFGLFFVCLDRGQSAGTAPLWVVGAARTGSLLLLGALLLLGQRRAPWPGRRFPAIALVGILDTTANVLFTYAAASGNLGVVSVLGSLYPIATVALARLVLAERLSASQSAGVALALAGVALIAAG